MTRKRVYWIAAVLVVLFVAGAAGGVIWQTQLRGRGALERAEQAFAKSDWATAKQNFQWYLARHPGDLAVLAKYAEAGSHLTANRRQAVQDVSNAYFRLASEAPARDPAAEQHCIEYAKAHELWPQLEYAASFFLRRDKDDAGFLYAQALANDRMGRANEAIDLYTALIAKGDAPWDAYGNLAVLLRSHGRSEQALAVLQDALKRDPNAAEAHVQSGRYFLAGGDSARAGEEAEAAVKLNPDAPGVQMLVAQVASAGRDWDTAAAAARRAIEQDGNLADGYIIHAAALEQKGEIDKAEEALSSIDPVVQVDHPQLFLTLAEMQINRDAFDRSQKTIDAYRAAYPDHTPVFDYLAARVLMRQKEPAKAIEKLKVVTVNSPDFLPAQLYLGAAYLMTSELDLARNTLELYLRNNPSDTRAMQLLASARADSTSYEESAAAATAVLSKGDATEASLVQAARPLMMVRDDANRTQALDMAEQLLRRALEKAPTSVEASTQLISLLTSQSKYDQAQEALAAAQAAGVPETELLAVQATLALVQKNLEQALAAKAKYFESGQLTPSEVSRWADAFAREGFVQEAIAMLDEAQAKLPEGERTGLVAEKVALCVRAGDLDQAQALVQSLQAGSDGGSGSASVTQAKLSLAEALIRERKVEDASALIAAVEGAEPDNLDARLLRARLFLLQDPPDVAQAEALAAKVDSETATTPWLLLLSELSARKGHWSRAAEMAQQAVDRSPDDLSARMSLAEAEWRTQRLPEAQVLLEELLQSQPNNLRAMDLLTRVYAARNMREQSQAILSRLEAAAGQFPELKPSVEATSAWVALYEKRWADAEPYFQSQVQEHADDVSALQALALVLSGMDRAAEAEALLVEATKRMGDRPEVWNVLGQYYLERGNTEGVSKASSAFTRALAQQRDFTPALLGLLEVQVRMGRPGAAVALCDRFLAQQPGDVEVLYQKARLLAGVPNRTDEALAAVQQAMSVSERPEFIWLRGMLQLDSAHYREALEDLKRVSDSQGVATPDLDLAMAEAYRGLSELEPPRKDEYLQMARQYLELAQKKSAAGESVSPERLDRMVKLLAPEEKS